MNFFPPTIILRHKKENLKKCSLRGLESRSDCLFFTYPQDELPDLSRYILLTIDAPELSLQDADYGIFLLDGTWRYAEKMATVLTLKMPTIKRSLPSSFKTAYPRKQDDCVDPSRGLSSLEALFVAYKILGRDASGMLDHYYWKEGFLEKNLKNFSTFDPCHN